MQIGLYTNKADIWPDDLRQLIQSAVFLAESIYIPATVRAAPVLPPKERAYIHSKLIDLHSLGAVTFWEVEGVRSFLPQEADALTLPIDKVMSREEYSELYESVIERLMANRSHFLKAETQVSVEGIAEIVRGKHVLWSYALKDFFGAHDILLDAPNANNNKLFFAHLLESPLTSVPEGVIEEVAMMLHLPDVSQLTMDQIETCRAFMPAFRDDLLKRINAGGNLIFDREHVIRKTADAIVDRFFEYMLEKTVEVQTSDQATAKWSLNRLLFSQEIKDQGDRFFKWVNQSDSPAPELLLWKLKSGFGS